MIARYSNKRSLKRIVSYDAFMMMLASWETLILHNEQLLYGVH